MKIAGRIDDIPINRAISNKQGAYALYVISSRAIPSVIDGMKPVQRRFIYDMYLMGLKPSAAYRKSGQIASDVMGKFHPHSDDAIYGAGANMASAWTRVKLIDGKGGFGLTYGDRPSAPRYTEMKLSQAGWEFSSELQANAVPMKMTFDNTNQEPEYLPSPWPNLLVNGAKGIAVGFACNFPQHNPLEVIKACRTYIDKGDKTTVDDILAVMPAPDWATGGTLVKGSEIREYYETGKGKLTIRGEVKGSGKIVTISELPYGISPTRIIDAVKKGTAEGRISSISDIAQLSGRSNNLEIEINVRRGHSVSGVIAELSKETDFESNFNVNMIALDLDGLPEQMGVIEVISSFIELRQRVIKRRSEGELDKAKTKKNNIAGVIKVVADLDTALAIIRGSKTHAAAEKGLREAFDVDKEQAEYVLSMQLRRLTGQDRLELEKELKAIDREVKRLQKLIDSPTARMKEIDASLAAWEDVFAPFGRKTRIGGEEIKAPAAVNSNSSAVSDGEWGITPDGYCGPTGTPLGDDTAWMVWSDGRIKTFKGKGLPKKVQVTAMSPDMDGVVAAGVSSDSVIIMSSSGKAIRLDLSKINPQGVAGKGVAGIKLRPEDTIIGAFGVTDNSSLITISGKTHKVTAVSDIPVKGRGSQGVTIHQFNKGDNEVVSAGAGEKITIGGSAAKSGKRSTRPSKGVPGDWSAE